MSESHLKGTLLLSFCPTEFTTIIPSLSLRPFFLFTFFPTPPPLFPNRYLSFSLQPPLFSYTRIVDFILFLSSSNAKLPTPLLVVSLGKLWDVLIFLCSKLPFFLPPHHLCKKLSLSEKGENTNIQKITKTLVWIDHAKQFALCSLQIIAKVIFAITPYCHRMSVPSLFSLSLFHKRERESCFQPPSLERRVVGVDSFAMNVENE